MGSHSITCHPAEVILPTLPWHSPVLILPSCGRWKAVTFAATGLYREMIQLTYVEESGSGDAFGGCFSDARVESSVWRPSTVDVQPSLGGAKLQRMNLSAAPCTAKPWWSQAPEYELVHRSLYSRALVEPSSRGWTCPPLLVQSSLGGAKLQRMNLSTAPCTVEPWWNQAPEDELVCHSLYSWALVEPSSRGWTCPPLLVQPSLGGAKLQRMNLSAAPCTVEPWWSQAPGDELVRRSLYSRALVEPSSRGWTCPQLLVQPSLGGAKLQRMNLSTAPCTVESWWSQAPEDELVHRSLYSRALVEPSSRGWTCRALVEPSSRGWTCLLLLVQSSLGGTKLQRMNLSTAPCTVEPWWNQAPEDEPVCRSLYSSSSETWLLTSVSARSCKYDLGCHPETARRTQVSYKKHLYTVGTLNLLEWKLREWHYRNQTAGLENAGSGRQSLPSSISSTFLQLCLKSIAMRLTE